MKRYLQNRKIRVFLAVGLLLGAGAAAQALVSISSTNFRIDNGAATAGGGNPTSTNFQAQASRIGPPQAILRTNLDTSVQDWKQLDD